MLKNQSSLKPIQNQGDIPVVMKEKCKGMLCFSPFLIAIILIINKLSTQGVSIKEIIKGNPVISPPTDHWSTLTFQNSLVMYDDGVSQTTSPVIYLKVARIQNEKTSGLFDWYVLPRGLIFTNASSNFWLTHVNNDNQESVDFHSKSYKYPELIRWFSPQQVQDQGATSSQLRYQIPYWAQLFGYEDNSLVNKTLGNQTERGIEYVRISAEDYTSNESLQVKVIQEYHVWNEDWSFFWYWFVVMFVILHIHGMALPRQIIVIFTNFCSLNNIQFVIFTSAVCKVYTLCKDVSYILFFAMNPFLFAAYVLSIVWPYYKLYSKGDAYPWESQESDGSYWKWRSFRARIWQYLYMTLKWNKEEGDGDDKQYVLNVVLWYILVQLKLAPAFLKFCIMYYSMFVVGTTWISRQWVFILLPTMLSLLAVVKLNLKEAWHQIFLAKNFSCSQCKLIFYFCSPSIVLPGFMYAVFCITFVNAQDVLHKDSHKLDLSDLQKYIIGGFTLIYLVYVICLVQRACVRSSKEKHRKRNLLPLIKEQKCDQGHQLKRIKFLPEYTPPLFCDECGLIKKINLLAEEYKPYTGPKDFTNCTLWHCRECFLDPLIQGWDICDECERKICLKDLKIHKLASVQEQHSLLDIAQEEEGLQCEQCNPFHQLKMITRTRDNREELNKQYKDKKCSNSKCNSRVLINYTDEELEIGSTFYQCQCKCEECQDYHLCDQCIAMVNGYLDDGSYLLTDSCEQVEDHILEKITGIQLHQQRVEITCLYCDEEPEGNDLLKYKLPDVPYEEYKNDKTIWQFEDVTGEAYQCLKCRWAICEKCVKEQDLVNQQ